MINIKKSFRNYITKRVTIFFISQKKENEILQFLVSTRPKDFEGRGKKKKDDKENIVVHGALASFFHDQSH